MLHATQLFACVCFAAGPSPSTTQTTYTPPATHKAGQQEETNGALVSGKCAGGRREGGGGYAMHVCNRGMAGAHSSMLSRGA